jgi:hypothetical protein
MKRALFFVYLDTHFIELARAAEVLRADGGYEPVFLFAYRYPAIAQDLERCRKAGYRCIDAAGRPLVPAPDAPPVAPSGATGVASPQFAPNLSALARLRRRLVPAGVRAKVLSFLAAWRGGSLRQLALSLVFPRLGGYLEHYRAQMAVTERIVEEVAPAVLVLPEDNVAYVTGLLIRAAHRRGIPALVIPYTIVNAEEIAEAYWHNPDYSLCRWRNRVAGMLFARWVHEHRDRSLLPLPADHIAAIELLGLAPPRPWIINSGEADAIAVEGPFMQRYYEQAGLAPEKLVVTGALYDDVLHRQIADAKQQRREPSQRPLLLCALPPDQYRSGRPGAEFDSYEKLVRAWAAMLAEAREFSVLLRLHPRTLREEVPYLESEYGLELTGHDTASLIPHCDLYVASVSATIRMAVACGKPVINYDCYRFRYRDFIEVPGVLTVEDAPAFARELRALADPPALEALAAKQRAFAATANLIDGRAHERLLGLINSLARRVGG